MGSLNIDSRLLFSDGQALTGTADSTNVLDFGVADPDLGEGRPIRLVIHIDVDAGGTTPTLSVALQDSADNSTYVQAIATETFAAAALTAGTEYVYTIPDKLQRYAKLVYTVGGTTPTVTVTAYLTAE